MKIQIKKLRPDAVIPTAGTAFSAGYDLYACMDGPVEIPPHETVMIHLGFSAAIPEGYFGAVFPRSGLASRQGLRLANCVGVCDCDYRGEYMVPLYNDSGEMRVVSPGDRVAQLVVLPCRRPNAARAASEAPEFKVTPHNGASRGPPIFCGSAQIS